MIGIVSYNNFSMLINDLGKKQPLFLDEECPHKHALVTVQTGDDEMRFCFFVREEYYRYSIPAKVIRDGVATVDASLWIQIMKRLPSNENDELILECEADSFSITSDHMDYKIQNLNYSDAEDYDDAEVELSLDELHKFIEDNQEHEISLEELASWQLDKSESDVDSLLERIKREPYDESAYSSALRLRDFAYAECREQIDECIRKCADEGVVDAMICISEKLTTGNNGKVDSEAFRYLVELADIGYIPSFRWLADCYERGIGCKQDLEKAKKLYLDGLIYEHSTYCRLMLKKLCPELCSYDGDNHSQLMLSKMIDSNDLWAAIKFAQMILDGQITGYSSEAAVSLLKEYIEYFELDCGFAAYSLAICLLNGDGCKEDPIIALKILEIAWESNDWMVGTEDEEWLRDEMEFVYQDYENIYKVREDIKNMLEVTKAKVKKLDMDMVCASHDGLTDPDEIYEAWLNERPLFIHE